MSPCSKCIALLSPPSIAQSAVSAKLCQIRPLLRPAYHGRPSIASLAEMVGNSAMSCQEMRRTMDSQMTTSGQVTHSPGRIGYASGKLPYNRLSVEVLVMLFTLRNCTGWRLYVHVPTSEFLPNREHLNGHCAVSRNGLPYRCFPLEDRSSSDKTLPRYNVRAFLYSAMIRGFSLGPASA
jgi:hypothetical protein